MFEQTHTYIQEILLEDGMHYNAHQWVKEYCTGVFPSGFVEEWFAFWRFSGGLNSTDIVVQADE